MGTASGSLAQSESVALIVEAPLEMRFEVLPPAPPDPAENVATPAKVALGRLLFFDPVLSESESVSCATCDHPDLGWADGRALPLGGGGHGIGPTRMLTEPARGLRLDRNVPSLLNVGYAGLLAGKELDPSAAPLFWDGRVQGLETQVPVPIQTAEEVKGPDCPESEALPQAVRRVAEISAYRDRFARAFGSKKEEAVTEERLVQALAAFERSLVAANSPFDQYLRGDETALDTLQKEGMQLFQTAGCIQCHGGPMLSDYQLHFLGVGKERARDRRAFRTPTLRNLPESAPFMHDGSLRTLSDVLLFYDELAGEVSETLDGFDGQESDLDPLLSLLALQESDFPALEAFMEALNDPNYDRSIPASVPSGLTPVPQYK